MISSVTQACEVTVQEAWVRLPPPMSDTAAVYMTLNNHCLQEKILQSISSPQAGMSMMHDARMHPMASLLLKPKQVFRFKPKAAHIMLMGLTSPIHINKPLLLILHWKNDYEQSLRIKVKDMRGQSMNM